MKKLCAIITGTLLLIFVAGEAYGQQVLVTAAKRKKLADLSVRLNNQYLSAHQRALALAKIHGWPIFLKTKNGGTISLQGVDALGYPVYLVTYDNLIAAETTNTNAVQPGGSLGLNLSGSGPGLINKLAEWDAGSVYTAHQEFAGKTITLHDPATPVDDHSTHVAGTMIATGIYPPAKGMAFNASTLQSYDFNNDIAEMSAAAPGLLLSNHSYGDLAGWYLNDVQGRWEWYGVPGDLVDYKFGFYDQRTQAFDNIAYNAPYYLIVASAGNEHGYPGPNVGVDYWGFTSSTDQTLVNKGPRPANISSNDRYDVISTTGNAKNILTVGAVNPLPNGPAISQDIVIALFSSWGPTDDGRIKPDIVGDGVNVTSTGLLSPTDYKTLSGTSMAAPNVTGSLYLLQEYYAQKNAGNFMRAATLKGLVCHTAFDAGNPGPDYIYGWGLLDTKQAAQAITDNGTQSLITEKTLQQGSQQTFTVVASGNAPLSATISWTDPVGTPTAEGIIDSRTPKLVNDLDIRVSDGTTTYLPWILDTANPALIAQKGDNIVDNIEQVFIPGAAFGKTYTITVSHKGTLQSGSQDYSLIVTGIGGKAYCSSSALSNADSRIDNLTLSNLNNSPPPGCTAYSDFTNLTVQLTQGKTYPLSVTLGTCGANFDKAAKVYIDWNGDGVFQPNELVATSNIMNLSGTYNTNITVPATVIAGNFSLMRVVLTETGDASTIQPCGSYAKGETQDYRVKFLLDSATASLILPGAVTGNITACQGTASGGPSVEQFNVSGQNLTANITVTAPVGFEVSLTPGGGFGNSLTLTQAGGAVSSTIIYVRSSTAAAAGNISANIVLTSAALTQNVKVTANIHAAPTISQVPNQGPYANGSTTLPINFAGTSENYEWVNNAPGIGLPASGSGNISAFTAVNTTNAPISATVTVTPTPYRFAYINDYVLNNVSVVNATTLQLITTIPVGKAPWGVSASADGNWIYVSNQEGNTVSVISTTTNTVIATVNVGIMPEGICVSPDGSKVYVANLISGTVSVISTGSNTITAAIPVGSNPQGLVVSPDGSRVYVVNGVSNSVSVIDAATNMVIATIPVGLHPIGISISPDGGKVYVANFDANTVSVINSSTNQVVSVIPVGTQPGAVCVSADGIHVYVINFGSNNISIINTATNTVNTINSGYAPSGLSLSLDGSQLFVTNSGDGTLSIFDTATTSLVTTISLGSYPSAKGNFISRGPGCDGNPVTFTITVNPTAVGPVISANLAAGTISTCAGSASASPNIQQFTVSGSNLTGDITAAAPAGFEISLSAAGGYGNTLTLTQTGGVVNNTTIYVRSATADPSGNISGNVMLTSAGAAGQNVAVTGTVNAPGNPSVSITASSNNICNGTPVTFTATPGNGGSAPVYQWLLDGNPTGTNNTTFTIGTPADGDVISCIMTSNAACIATANGISNSIMMNVSSSQTPSVSIAVSANDICPGTAVTFTATPVNGGSAPVYQWLLNGNPAGQNNPIFTSNKLADGDVISCVMTSNAACVTPANANSNSIPVIVEPLVTVDAGTDKSIAEGGSTILNATVTGNVASITWSPVTGLSNYKILNPVASPTSTITYTVIVQTTGGCVAMDDVKIVVMPKVIFIPDAFTPNGDGINDTWAINTLDPYPVCTVRVFNRWGQIVYSSIGYGIPWNGTYKGASLASGTYYYVIDLKNNSKLLSGFVNVIR